MRTAIESPQISSMCVQPMSAMMLNGNNTNNNFEWNRIKNLFASFARTTNLTRLLPHAEYINFACFGAFPNTRQRNWLPAVTASLSFSFQLFN